MQATNNLLERKSDMQINLAGAEGNAFFLISIMHRVARECGMAEKSAQDLAASMRSGTYIHLLECHGPGIPRTLPFSRGPARRVSSN
jgi:hypothetical protein